MKSLLFICFSVLLSAHLSAQAYVYKTEEDYINNEGTSYTSFERHYNIGMTDYALFMQNGNKVEIKCNTIWGFKSEAGDLYRIYKIPGFEKNGEPLLLLGEGKFCIWLDGTKKVKKEKVTYYVIFIYCSNDLLSEIYTRSIFIEKNPKYSPLDECAIQDLNCELEYLYSLGEKE